MSQTSKRNNYQLFSMQVLKAPNIGDIYIDPVTGIDRIWDGIDWRELIPGVDTNAPFHFKIFITNDISYAKIISQNWWMDNHEEILQWLTENNAGYFIDEFKAISFFDHKFATAFKLQYG